MLLAITGSHGKIGRFLKSDFERRNIKFITLSRSTNVNASLHKNYIIRHDFDILIDLGWNTKDRTEKEQMKCANFSIHLNQYCQENNKMYIFVSSVTAVNPVNSQYGKAKKYVEQHLKGNSVIIRPGLVIFKKKKSLVNVTNFNENLIYLPCINIEDLSRTLIKCATNNLYPADFNAVSKIVPINRIYLIPHFLSYKFIIYLCSKVLSCMRFLSNFNYVEDRIAGLIEVDNSIKSGLIQVKNLID